MARFEVGKHYGFDGGLVAEVVSRSAKYVTAETPEYGTRRYRIGSPDGEEIECIRIDGTPIRADREVGPHWSDEAERTVDAWSRDQYLGGEPSAEVMRSIRSLAWNTAYNMGHADVTPQDAMDAIRHTLPLLPYLA